MLGNILVKEYNGYAGLSGIVKQIHFEQTIGRD